MDSYVIGSLNMDMVVAVGHIPKRGETIFADQYFENCGGKGANQAVACAKLGSKVKMIGKVGKDGFGKQMIENLQANGVEESFVTVSDSTNSGIAMIIIHDGDNRIILDKGANYQLTEEDIDAGLSDAVDGDLLIMQLEIPIEIVYHALQIAKSKKMRTLLNPAPAKQLNRELLGLVDMIVLNETEAEIITGITEEEQWIKALQKLGISSIVLTLGEKGAIVYENSLCTKIPARKVEVVDTTAAGDTYIGGIAYSMQQGSNLVEACKFASVAASITVTRQGASKSIPTLAEVISVMSKG